MRDDPFFIYVLLPVFFLIYAFVAAMWASVIAIRRKAFHWSKIFVCSLLAPIVAYLSFVGTSWILTALEVRDEFIYLASISIVLIYLTTTVLLIVWAHVAQSGLGQRGFPIELMEQTDQPADDVDDATGRLPPPPRLPIVWQTASL